MVNTIDGFELVDSPRGPNRETISAPAADLLPVRVADDLAECPTIELQKIEDHKDDATAVPPEEDVSRLAQLRESLLRMEIGVDTIKFIVDYVCHWVVGNNGSLPIESAIAEATHILFSSVIERIDHNHPDYLTICSAISVNIWPAMTDLFSGPAKAKVDGEECCCRVS